MPPKSLPTRSDVVSIDPTDPQQWGPAVERMAEKMAERMWGAACWYRGAANDALTAVFPNLDPKDTQRVAMVYFNPPEQDPQGSGPFGF